MYKKEVQNLVDKGKAIELLERWKESSPDGNTRWFTIRSDSVVSVILSEIAERKIPRYDAMGATFIEAVSAVLKKARTK